MLPQSSWVHIFLFILHLFDPVGLRTDSVVTGLAPESEQQHKAGASEAKSLELIAQRAALAAAEFSGVKRTQ